MDLTLAVAEATRSSSCDTNLFVIFPTYLERYLNQLKMTYRPR